MGLEELGLCFSFGGWGRLCTEFYSLIGTSIVESVVLSSQGLLRSEVPLQATVQMATSAVPDNMVLETELRSPRKGTGALSSEPSLQTSVCSNKGGTGPLCRLPFRSSMPS